ncbi:HAD family hydrolase [Celeribacter neptunius]|uniref:Haloacid dehalogenase superfamily, subfamily IA, variant 3 with third motif having DD or ED n=1 Tax=Celeribacter neptunius TaxID=588602 RepID=A0A1I3WY75_9RHOB|nr:HAD-IA family hydrolase [Celeribacter neptunius]SFK12089.1 haloacid dehalogenase superfamily, subfamily IA, variant 3 with third motif having DD or ED [Celeribacter neptunius]
MSVTDMPPRLVIFDCDGVIVDSEPPLLEFLRDEFARFGLNISLHELETKYVGGTMATVGDRARAAGAKLPEDWQVEVYPRVFEMLRSGVPLIPGIEAAFDALDAAGIPYCVGSNGPMEKMDVTLGAHPAVFERLKGRIHSAHTHGVAKPDPGLFLIAAESMGVAPEHCLVIDDSPSGCIAARRAGMRCFGFDPHGDGTRLIAEGATHLTDMFDLPRRIGV